MAGRSPFRHQVKPRVSSGGTGSSVIDAGLLAAMAENGWEVSDAVRQVVADGWWPGQVLDWFEWGSLRPTARAPTKARTVIEADDGRHEFAIDANRLRAPYPPELGFPAQSGQQAPFIGPGGNRLWFQPLQPRPGAPVDSWGMAHARGERETLSSMQGIGQFAMAPFAGSDWPQWGATVSTGPGVIAVGCRFKDHNRRLKERPGSSEMTWYVPAVSVARVEISTSFQLGRPLPLNASMREARALIDERGYGVLTKGWMTVTYSDGWRLCRLSSGGTWTRQSEETHFLNMVDGVLATVAQAQGCQQPAGVTLPDSSSTVGNSPGRLRGLVPGTRDVTDVVTFSDAVHWGIPMQWVDAPASAPVGERTLRQS